MNKICILTLKGTPRQCSEAAAITRDASSVVIQTWDGALDQMDHLMNYFDNVTLNECSAKNSSFSL